MEKWDGVSENHEQCRNEDMGWPAPWIWVRTVLLWRATLDQSQELSDSICRMGRSWLQPQGEPHTKTYNSWHIIHAQ